MVLTGTDRFCKILRINMFAAKNIFTLKNTSGGGNAGQIFYSLVGGGGNGGVGPTESFGNISGGGGGAGQVINGSFTPLINTNYPIVVCPNGYSGTRAATSAFSITAATGGNGGKIGVSINGGSGAQGGGGSFTYGSGNPYPISYYGAGGSSTIGSYIGGQGNPYASGSGGGGGAGGVGGAANGIVSPYIAGTGGVGLDVTIAGNNVTLAAGGGGGTQGAINRRGIGGSGIGGNGGYVSSSSPYTPVLGSDGAIDTGSGGGGSPYNSVVGKGANGVVNIWYYGSVRASVTGSVTTTSQNGFTLHKFTGNGGIYFTS